MDVEERIELIMKKPTDEILTESDLREKVESGEKLKHYIGFEISGLVHLGTGLMSGAKIADLQKSGVETSIFMADWHSWINNKLGGDIDFIREFGMEYFAKALLMSMEVMGADPNKINVVRGTDLYKKSEEYWETVIDVSKNVTLSRIKRSVTILGREMGDSISFAQLIYPPMQVADIFIQGINIAHAGTDQRKAHVIARDVANKLKFPTTWKSGKPIALHHKLLQGLQVSKEIAEKIKNASADEKRGLLTEIKMSKSKPKTAIFVHDTEEEIRSKIKSAYCLAGEVEINPVLDIAENIILRNDVLYIKRSEKFGGDVQYENVMDLKNDFAHKKLHPLDLKNAVADWLVEKLEPIREKFSKGKEYELMNMIKQKVSR